MGATFHGFRNLLTETYLRSRALDSDEPQLQLPVVGDIGDGEFRKTAVAEVIPRYLKALPRARCNGPAEDFGPHRPGRQGSVCLPRAIYHGNGRWGNTPRVPGGGKDAENAPAAQSFVS